MSAPLLIKHPAESRLYAFDFAGGPAGGQRGTVWSAPLLNTAAGEVFADNVMVPLLLNMTAAVAPPTVGATRSDGQASDLSVSAVRTAGNLVLLLIAGGTDGLTYTLTCTVQTSAGNVLTQQGALLVTARLP